MVFVSKTIKPPPSNCKVAHQQSGEAELGFLFSPVMSGAARWDSEEDRDGDSDGNRDRPELVREGSAHPSQALAQAGVSVRCVGTEGSCEDAAVMQRAVMLRCCSTTAPELEEMLTRVFNSKLQSYASYCP